MRTIFRIKEKRVRFTLKAPRVTFFSGLGEAVGARLEETEAAALGLGDELRNRVSKLSCGRSGSSSDVSTTFFLRRFAGGAIGWEGGA